MLPLAAGALAIGIFLFDTISTVEIASWMGLGGQKSQTGFAVYEFDGNRIKRVYYFPEER